MLLLMHVRRHAANGLCCCWPLSTRQRHQVLKALLDCQTTNLRTGQKEAHAVGSLQSLQLARQKALALDVLPEFGTFAVVLDRAG